jgi:hypothetical protein
MVGEGCAMDAPWADDPVRSWLLVALEPVRQVLSDHYILDVELLLASLEDSVGSRLHFYGKAHSAALADESHSTRFEYPPDSPKDSHQARRSPADSVQHCLQRLCHSATVQPVQLVHYSACASSGRAGCVIHSQPNQPSQSATANGPGSSQSKAQRVDLGRPCRWYSASKS